MAHSIASVLETTVVLATLVAGAVFAFDAVQPNYGPAPTGQVTAAIMSNVSASHAQAAQADKPTLLRVNQSTCAEAVCEEVILHPILQVPSNH